MCMYHVYDCIPTMCDAHLFPYNLSEKNSSFFFILFKIVYIKMKYFVRCVNSHAHNLLQILLIITNKVHIYIIIVKRNVVIPLVVIYFELNIIEGKNEMFDIFCFVVWRILSHLIILEQIDLN